MQSKQALQADIDRMDENAKKQNDLRSMFRSMVRINIFLLVVVMFGLVFITVYIAMRRPVEYFARSPDGRVVPLIPLSQSMSSNNTSLFNFGDDALQASFVLDFKNYFTQIANAEP